MIKDYIQKNDKIMNYPQSLNLSQKLYIILVQSTMYPIKIKAHERNVNIVRFNYDGDLFFSGQTDRIINVFESYTGQLLGSYTTKVAVKTLDVDMNSKYLVYGSFDGTLEMFNVSSGQRLLVTNFPYCKIYHLQFDLSSKKLIVVYQFQMCAHVKIIDFQHFVNIKPRTQTKQIKPQDVKVHYTFSLKTEEGVKTLSEKARWYVDNQSIFMGTHSGDVVHYSQNGKLIKKASIHPEVKIRSVSFSHDFSILATAARDGCKVINPQTLEILRVFKQQHPMNDVSISPLFNHPINPKHHLIMAGGVDAKQAAQTKGAGFDVHLCNVMHGNEIGKLLTHFSPISSLQFFKDGLGYVSCADDAYITIVRFEQSYFTDAVYE